MTLSDEQRRVQRGAAHKLKPVVLLGKAGLTDPVLVEVNSALDHHELIKVKVRDDDREQRRATITGLVEKTGAELIQVIGQIAVLYRAAPPVDEPREKRRERSRPEPRTPERSRNPRRDAFSPRTGSPRCGAGRGAGPSGTGRPKGARAASGPRRPAPTRKR